MTFLISVLIITSCSKKGTTPYMIPSENVVSVASCHDDVLCIVQAPLDTKLDVTTYELFHLVIRNPFSFNMMAFNPLRLGFLTMLDQVPELRCLLSRPDFGSTTVNLYETLPSLFTRGGDGTSLDFWILETILARPEVKEMLTIYEISSIFDIALQRYNERSELPESYSLPAFPYFIALLEHDYSFFERFGLCKSNVPHW